MFRSDLFSLVGLFCGGIINVHGFWEIFLFIQKTGNWCLSRLIQIEILFPFSLNQRYFWTPPSKTLTREAGYKNVLLAAISTGLLFSLLALHHMFS